MNINLSKLARYIPLLAGILILLIGSMFVPWGDVAPYLFKLSPLSIFLLVGCSVLYYLGRILRYYFMLKFLDKKAPFWRVALACLIAQPVAVLPGGELYRSAMLRRYANVALKDGLPSVFAQSIAETTGLLIIAVIGTILLQKYIGAVLVVAVSTFAIYAAVRWQSTKKSHRTVNKLPFINVSLLKVNHFLKHNRILLGGKNFIVLVMAAYVSILGGISALLITSNALDVDLNAYQAALGFALPTILEGVSFLPGGIGVNEQGSVGLLTLFDVALPAAVAMTIFVRLTTLGSGFVYGFVAFVIAKLFRIKEYS